MTRQQQELAVTVVIGIVAGWLASWITGGGGIIKYALSGILGAFVGSYLLAALNVDLGIKNALAARVATAAIGAVVVSVVAKFIA